MALFKRKKSAEPEKGAQKTEKEKAVKSPAIVKDVKKEAKTASGISGLKAGKDDKAESGKIEKTKKQSMKDLYGGGQGKTGAKAGLKKDDKTAKGKPQRVYGNAYKAIVKPLVTEKAANLGSENKYVFAVDTRANKIEIARAISEVYGVDPLQINIISVKGKKVRHGRTIGQRKNWKKAVITLPAGKTIKVYEGV